ncbi:hypothetical protein GCM10011404_34370 [Sphingomonas prati]|nr:hypothetical protein GCM10011404_34370 [Sphingomonas prati]
MYSRPCLHVSPAGSYALTDQNLSESKAYIWVIVPPSRAVDYALILKKQKEP